MKQYPFSATELAERIARNQRRLTEPYYQIDQVFMPDTYDWPGDKEGRALLAFVCHAKMGSEPIPCMEQMIGALPEKTNAYGYFGPTDSGVIDEQQLSGHSWYLRGLCEYYELTGSALALETVRSTVEHLYLPLSGKMASYPITERGEKGGVSGSASAVCTDGWRLSSDVGCAFMSIDGLSHAYELLRDERILNLLYEMVEVFDRIDKCAIKAQTHCSLSAARGMIRMYRLTHSHFYLARARRIADLYLEKGMTLTNQNMNWWGRPDSWTEPCAIVDSLMVCHSLYALTGEIVYRMTAIRIAHNGFATIQRENGGAGCETVVMKRTDPLKIFMDEAPFCCTMRLSEGLRYLKEHLADFTARISDAPTREGERVMLGDLLLVQVTKDTEPYVDQGLCVPFEEKIYAPIPKFYRIPMETAKSLTLLL